MQTQDGGGDQPPKEQHLQVQVRYVAASRPFNESESPSTTLQALKPAVLAFFNLVEGSVGTGTKTYDFSLDGHVLTDLSATLGTLAAGKHELKLLLVEQFTQG